MKSLYMSRKIFLSVKFGERKKAAAEITIRVDLIFFQEL